MITHSPALYKFHGFSYYMKIQVFMRVSTLSRLEAICEDFSQQTHGISFLTAIKRELMCFDYKGKDYWTVGVGSLAELNHLSNMMEDFNGTAYFIENEIHEKNLERFEGVPWIVLPKEDPTLPTYWLYLKKSDEVIDLIDKFVLKNKEVKSLHHRLNYVICFDSDTLLLQAKLAFPSIDKIEKLINVNELGERLL